MEYRKYGDAYYVRLDRGDEIISSLISMCVGEGVQSATFSGIGGCGDAEIKVFSPAEGVFRVERVEGMLELVSIMGNVISDGFGNRSCHAHALFSYEEDGEHRIVAGHLGSSTVRYTAEIEVRPVVGGVIGARHDTETGTNFWEFPPAGE